MAETDIVVAGRTYRIGCEDGQEDHVVKLASLLDAEVRALTGGGGVMREGQLLVMVALMLADRLEELTATLDGAAIAEAPAGGGDAAALEAAMARLHGLVENDAS
jgi:cell division protein ZapA